MPPLAVLLSTIHSAPLSYFVYSSLSFFGRQRGGELPGMWFVSALDDAGRDLAAVRQTLYRMEKEGELIGRKAGRAKFYRATSYANAEIDAGLQKILEPPARNWDGRWTIVHLNLPAASQRVTRERVVALLAVEGFALVSQDFYIHPRDVGERVSAALSTGARSNVIVIRGRLENDAASQSIVSLWQVDRLAQRYRRVQTQLRELEALVRTGISDRDAFLFRFAVMFAFLGVAWDDPGLPHQVLPDDWPGEETRRLAARLYERLLGPAIRYADRLLQETGPATRQSTTQRHR